MFRSTILSAFLIGLLVSMSNSACAQAIGNRGEDRTLASMQLENVKIEAQSIGQLFSHLSLVYNIPIGVEAVINDDEAAIYRLNFRKATLLDLLSAFVKEHSE